LVHHCFILAIAERLRAQNLRWRQPESYNTGYPEYVLVNAGFYSRLVGLISGSVRFFQHCATKTSRRASKNLRMGQQQ
jgi:hypothetical protein